MLKKPPSRPGQGSSIAIEDQPFLHSKFRLNNGRNKVFLCRRQEIAIQRFNVCWERSGFDDSVTTNVNRWSANAVKHKRHLLPQNENMANIIKLCAPNLEEFFCSFFLTQDYSLEVSSPLSGEMRLSSGFLESNLADVGNDWEAGLPIPGMLSHLKFVQMEEVVGSDAELKLLSFLLKNAKALEKFALFFRSSAGSGDRGRQVKQFKNKLRLVPAASSRIRTVVVLVPI
ncbi:hypothetical protein MKW98_016651 [Papaver atlanticum]|uniref:FBD domain-containing protein n=1 Tax=Papaver atlanticum TaxID=357466 RepID=A0AAD4SR53_9MAGN|nr:hypothetical protein MKW98_016651 [Papaver atlanticum]